MFIGTLDLTTAATAEDFFIAPPVICRLVKATTCIYTVLTTADLVITFSDGTTDIGTITITQSGSAEGDIDLLTLDTTSLGVVDIGPSQYLKVELDGGPDAGAAILVMVFDEFHAD